MAVFAQTTQHAQVILVLDSHWYAFMRHQRVNFEKKNNFCKLSGLNVYDKILLDISPKQCDAKAIKVKNYLYFLRAIFLKL